MKICSFCGEKIKEEAKVCPFCGVKTEAHVETLIEQEEEKEEFNPFGFTKRKYNKWISLLLCIFLGIFGVHKFYERKYFMGVIYLFTWGVFGIGWIIDIITLIQKPNPYYLYQ